MGNEPQNFIPAFSDQEGPQPGPSWAKRGWLDTLAASGAGSVLLGGTRQAKASGDCSPLCINASGTQRTTVDLGTQALQLEELLLAATDEVSLATGTSLRANSTGTLGARTLTSQGDGALLAVSANALTLPRSGTAGATGALTIAAGSTLAGATVALDATGSTALDQSLSLQAGALTLSARQLVVGSAAAVDAGATVLDGKLLTAARDSRDLSLRAYTGIDFAGAQDWSQRDADTGMATHVKQRLVLDAPQLRGVAGADGSAAAADISAQTVVLRNSTGQVAEASATGGGTLTLQALPALAYGSTGGLAIGPGAQRLGFDSTALRSSGDLVLQGSGSLAAQGALTLSSARVTATTGAEQTLTAAGALRVATEAGSRTLGERVGSGASITLAGATLAQDGRIELPGGQLSLQASSGEATDANLRFGAGSLTSVASFTLDSGDGLLADGQAGRLSASTASGRIAVLGTLDASAAARSGGTGDGGRISLQASGDGGTLQLQATQADGSTVTGQLLARSGSASGDLGGQLQVDVQQLASADTLAQASTAGGISGSWALRVRTGDVTLDSSLRAQRISLATDNGTLTVGGSSTPLSLDARARSGGVLQLGAGQDLVLGAGVQLLAGATAPTTAIGGDILLASRDGWVRPATTAVVDAQGSDGIGGRIVLRASRDDTAGTVAVGRLNTSQLRAAEVAIEAVRVYDGIDTITSGLSSGGTLGQTSVARDNAAFMARAPGIAEALGVASADAGRVRVRTGVEVRGEGDIVLDTDWDLARDRAGGEAGFLTVRAAGNLFIDATLSDGFASTASIVGTDRRAALNGNTRSWSMRLAAGADLSATLPTTVRPHTGQDDETATLAIAAGKMVRTGAGSIELAAGRDVQFLGDDGSTPGGSAPAGQAYVAGRGLSASEAPAATLFPGTTNKPLFSTGGGRLAVSAERDITAPEATQLINNWYWRSGLLSTTGSDVGQYRTDNQLAWWSQFDRFKQTLGSFAGGSLRVEAGRDLQNVQAVAPTAGWADSRDPATASLHTLGGGEVTASAGRDVAGGQFLLGGGVGRLDAGRQVRNASDNVSLATPVLALNDGQWRLSGRSGIAVTSPFNPTAVSAAEADNRSGASGFFYTWGAGAGLSAVSNAGAILLQGGPTETPLQALGLAVAAGDDRSFQVTVPTLRLTAAGGDLTLLGGDGQSSAVMFPSATGQLSLWAGGNLRLGGEVSGQLVMSDSAPASFPTALSPATPGNDNTLVQSLILATLSDSLPLTGLHANDSEPVRLHAEQALQVRGKALGRASTTLLLPKAAVLSAGTDITELSLRVQQLSADDETRITAGRHLQALAFGQVEVAGPGALSVTAGQDLDLGASAGITTTGNLYSASLPAGGASVSLRAAASGTVDLNVLQASYLRDGANPRAALYRSALLGYVREALKSPALDEAQAWAQFQRFPAQAQAALAQQLLAAEFSAVYLAGSTPTAAQYTSALKATFERLQAQAVAGIEQALAQGTILRLPGVAAAATVAQAMAALPSSATAGLATGGAPITAATDPRYQAALQRYLTSIRALSFAGIDTDAQVSQRIGTLAVIRSGWREATAASLGSTAAALDALAIAQPQDARVQAWQAALADTTSARFLRYRDQALQQELDSTGRAGSAFSAAALPMRNAFYAQGLQVADLAGLGSGIAQPVWQSAAPLLAYNGALDMTQSAVVTERGGNIRLLNPGGAITVGLKDTSGSAGASTAKGVIALGGGNILGYARDDFQVNTQRVFVVGQGDMGIFTVNGDIDSGRGANTAVAAPPLVARRAVDGVVFETPATTTGSGLGILENAQGQRSGTIGLYPAFGEILALDAFIRAPSVVLGASIKGADNLQSASVGGAAAAVAAPVLSVSAPASQQETRTADAAAAAASAEARPRNALLTVDLLGLGPDGTPAAECSEAERRDGKCPAPPKPCSAEDKAKGLCK
ncbi:MAG: hypothetical protein CFE45_02985 [Burkholderiales bacterium PBB5]|nr:MAG: hypothetical protein CFE45_02985 [Burkholderiales bacterium PBB5]